MKQIKVAIPDSVLDEETKKIKRKCERLEAKVKKLESKIRDNERKFVLVQQAWRSLDALADELRGSGFGEDYNDWGV